jgi:hypothetical protein
MAEYSRLASGRVTSTGGQTAVIIPFIPNFIAIENQTRAVAGAGVTSASWMTDMGQGAAVLNTFGTGAQFIGPTGSTGLTSGGLTAGTGFNILYAGLSQQYGPTVFLGASGGITKNSTAPVVTTTTAHGLVVGDVVIFSNLYETTTTGMQQIAGIPFQVVTVPSTTSFTINWNTNQTNYTAITAGGLNVLASYKQVLHPVLYAPGDAVISALTLGVTTSVQTTVPTNVKIDQQVAFRIPTLWGTSQLNSLPNVVIPGSPRYGYVVSVTDSTNFVVNINSSAFTPYTSNIPFVSFAGLKFPYLVPVGDVSTGGESISATSSLYPSPRVFNGLQGSVSVADQVRTINGPAIQGAFINATYMGFTIGSGISGTLGDVIYYRAYLHDINRPESIFI